MKLPLRAYLLFSLILGFASAQITGTVSDPNGNPLAGANVVVSGTSYGAAAASDGTYSIDISDLAGQASVSLTATYIGYTTQTTDVDISSGSATQNFSLAVDAIGLKAVSVTALGFETDRDKQGSTSVSVTPADMTRSGESTLANSLAL